MAEAQPPIVAVDIGGTHARFAIGQSHAGGIALGDIVTLQTRDLLTSVQPGNGSAKCTADHYPAALPSPLRDR